MKTRTANVRVRWAGEVLPPDLFVGNTVCAAGKMKTWDGGRNVYVVDAVPIPAGQKAMQRFMALLDELCADPVQWAPHLLHRNFPRA